MITKQKQEAQNPLILRCHRLMEAFTKSDDERDFYLDKTEGFILYVDLDKSEDELKALEAELGKNSTRYALIPKLTFYETKKIMEGFVNEKVYDIDTKEKLLDIIQSKEARENFLEFLYDHHAELEKWQQYYQERSRVRIIEWLRQNGFHFVFEEDLDIGKATIENLKKHLFDTKAGKDIQNARKMLSSKAKTYYSNEALNPRPKRGRPPKQAAKLEIEPQLTEDIYTTVVPGVRPFLFKPDISSSSAITFSSKFDSEDKFQHTRKQTSEADAAIDNLNQKLASLRSLSSRWMAMEAEKQREEKIVVAPFEEKNSLNNSFVAKENDFVIKKKVNKRPAPQRVLDPKKMVRKPQPKRGDIVSTKKPVAKKAPAKKAVAKKAPVKKAAAKKPVKKVVKRAAAKKSVTRKKTAKKK